MVERWGLRNLELRAEAVAILHNVRLNAPVVGDLLFDTFIQGVGNAPASRGTHLEGWCADFSFRDHRWSRAMGLVVAHSLLPGFAVAFRHFGELGPSSPAHLHIAYKWEANARLIVERQESIGPLAIREAINRCFAF